MIYWDWTAGKINELCPKNYKHIHWEEDICHKLGQVIWPVNLLVFLIIGCKTLKILPFILPLEGPKDAKPFLNFIIIPLTTKND